MDESIFDEHTIYFKCSLLDKNGVKNYVKYIMDKLFDYINMYSTNNYQQTTYYYNFVTNYKGRTLMHFYLWCESEIVYNILSGLYPDGREMDDNDMPIGDQIFDIDIPYPDFINEFDERVYTDSNIQKEIEYHMQKYSYSEDDAKEMIGTVADMSFESACVTPYSENYLRYATDKIVCIKAPMWLTNKQVRNKFERYVSNYILVQSVTMRRDINYKMFLITFDNIYDSFFSLLMNKKLKFYKNNRSVEVTFNFCLKDKEESIMKSISRREDRRSNNNNNNNRSNKQRKRRVRDDDGFYTVN